MATFVLYQPIPAELIRKEAKEAIEKITQWFANNPKRRVCRCELWYGQQLSIKPKTIKEQIESAAQEAINGKKKVS